MTTIPENDSVTPWQPPPLDTLNILSWLFHTALQRRARPEAVTVARLLPGARG